jgi:pyrroloquinoline quinone (PQQ) biosynthesis protein C
MTKWKLPEGTPIDYKERYEAAVRDAKEAEAYAEDLEARAEAQAPVIHRLRRKLEILKLDAAKNRGQLYHDLQECLALLDIIQPQQ